MNSRCSRHVWPSVRSDCRKKAGGATQEIEKLRKQVAEEVETARDAL